MPDPFEDDVVIDSEPGEVGLHNLRVQRSNGKTTVVCRTCKETLLELVAASAEQVETAIENHR